MNTSYYVKASGNDANDGLTDATPFQTLAKAVDMAKRGGIKTITVIGTLDETSEANADEALPKDPAEAEQYGAFGKSGKSGSIFYIKDSGKDRILITGCDNAILQGIAPKETSSSSPSSHDGIVWTWQETTRNMRVLHVSGISNIQLENIIITAGAVRGIERKWPLCIMTSPPSAAGPHFYPPNGHGGGIFVSDGAKITLGKDVIVRNNIATGGGGIAVTNGILEIAGGEVTENKAIRGGGIHISDNSITNMWSGNINNNIVFGKLKTAQKFRSIPVWISEQSTGLGGGVYVDSDCIFNMSSGIIENNTTQAKEGSASTFDGIGTSRTGFSQEISKKTGLRGGGVYVNGGTFKMSNGIVTNNKAQKGNDLCYTKGSAFGQRRGTIHDKVKVE